MRHAVLGAAIAVVLVAGSLPAVSAETTGNGSEGAALVVIDIQNFYFPGGQMPLVGADEAAAKAAELVACFRRAGQPVIWVQHLPTGVNAPDPTGIEEPYRMRANLLPAEGEAVIGKHYANAFRGTDLEATLRRFGVKKLVICGMQTHMCVEAAVRAAADLGFEVTVVPDACATRDLEFGDVTVPAAEVQAAALAAMTSAYAKAIPVAELCASMP
jgi:nicotinamidase-related amidase